MFIGNKKNVICLHNMWLKDDINIQNYININVGNYIRKHTDSQTQATSDKITNQFSLISLSFVNNVEMVELIISYHFYFWKVILLWALSLWKSSIQTLTHPHTHVKYSTLSSPNQSIEKIQIVIVVTNNQDIHCNNCLFTDNERIHMYVYNCHVSMYVNKSWNSISFQYAFQ